jgi:hypothetical protein
MLASDPTASATRAAAAPGDLRLLFSTFQGQPTAVLYRPVVPGTAQPVQLMAARLDRIERLDQANVAVRRSSASYSVEAAIPFAALGLRPGDGERLRGDLGVISSDAAGRDRIKRSYHFNRKTDMTADLTAEATLQPAEWGPLRFPLGKNLLRDGGFENGFAAKPDTGWSVTECYGGMTATNAAAGAHSGQRGLLLRQVLPVIYPAEAFAAPDYRDFIKAANSGKGGGNAVVAQRVPVTGGRRYSLRFFQRTEGMKGNEVKAPSKDRGYTALSASIDWIGGKSRHTGVLSLHDNTEGWAETLNAERGYFGVAREYVAPAEAAFAIISFRATVNAPDHLPSMAVDDVEFVEAAP